MNNSGRKDIADAPVGAGPDSDEEPVWSSPNPLDVLVAIVMCVILCVMPGMLGAETFGEAVAFPFGAILIFALCSLAIGLVRLVRCDSCEKEGLSASEAGLQTSSDEDA